MAEIVTCPDCNGSGQVIRPDSDNYPSPTSCPRCDGTGQVYR